MEISTLCIHGSTDSSDTTGSITVPIYQTATFVHPAVGQSTGYDYSRVQNPTREQVEKIIAKLEKGVDALAFSSGMAAIAAMMELFEPGDHIIASEDLYGGSIRLFNNLSRKNGITFDYINMSKTEDIVRVIKPETKAVFIETPSNPMMQVTDIAEVAKITKDRGLLLIVDNTFLTPYFQLPLRLGADIVIHSGTKYLSGHNDTLAGFLVVNSEELSQRLRYIYKTTGACLSPFDSWLIIRGLKTLAVRMEKQQENATRLATWLSNHSRVTKVYYPGLVSHPDYEISKKQARGFGAMISFEVDSEETARKILERVKIALYAESLGGVESLITYPMLQTHADVPKEEREAKGIHERLLRMSVGIEDINDIIEDLAQALLS
ncbi:PLP-dependent transferase [Mobilitalea sibirica]|uniref:PLP-dependent transferase n=1 Tax=Mobilitalea sibirica TaxID=1462919 RepID=A0A8J7H1Z5_9FIRM|nr:PLP-dependent aspartate aminotransferase family protein [Mobilitalea sibirica]MBH1940618.1 PLP-dependent transferase [Mobilitalea sibirica]